MLGLVGRSSGKRAQADLEVPIAGSNSTESMKIFFFLLVTTQSAQTPGGRKQEKKEGGGVFH